MISQYLISCTNCLSSFWLWKFKTEKKRELNTKNFTAAEQRLVDEIFTAAIQQLSDQDRELPQIESSLKLLRRGVGVHHGGLLPIVKEATEILFGEGLVKVFVCCFASLVRISYFIVDCVCILKKNLFYWNIVQLRDLFCSIFKGLFKFINIYIVRIKSL